MLALALILAVPAAAQRAKPEAKGGAAPEHPPVPTVTFTLDFPQAMPAHYVIRVESSGKATYRSDAPEDGVDPTTYATPGKPPAPGDPYGLNFTMSAETRERIFTLAAKLNYFRGNFDYTKGRIAASGIKTVVYADPTRHNETRYNWSENPLVEELTRLFQNLAQTVEFGRHLDHMYRYDRLGIDAELRRMEEAAGNNELVELQAIAPSLQRIVDDTAVLHIARLRAEKLLARLRPAAGAPSPLL